MNRRLFLTNSVLAGGLLTLAPFLSKDEKQPKYYVKCEKKAFLFKMLLEIEYCGKQQTKIGDTIFLTEDNITYEFVVVEHKQIGFIEI